MQAICSVTMKIMLFSQIFLRNINCFTKELSTILEPLSISLMFRSNKKKQRILTKSGNTIKLSGFPRHCLYQL